MKQVEELFHYCDILPLLMVRAGYPPYTSQNKITDRLNFGTKINPTTCNTTECNEAVPRGTGGYKKQLIKMRRFAVKV